MHACSRPALAGWPLECPCRQVLAAAWGVACGVMGGGARRAMMAPHWSQTLSEAATTKSVYR